jgi:hypothetical protein
MAGRVIVQAIISGATMFTKAFFSAYQQALRSELVLFSSKSVHLRATTHMCSV